MNKNRFKEVSKEEFLEYLDQFPNHLVCSILSLRLIKVNDEVVAFFDKNSYCIKDEEGDK